VLDTPKPPLAVTADKAYDSVKVRQQIKDEGALPVIPSRCNATRKAYCPKRFYRRRHKIENYFCRIKDWRRIATRYDKLARNFLAATALVGASTGSNCESRPFCNGPVDVNCPRDRHAAELMLLSVVDAEAATLCC
jgi:transposase